MPAEQPRWRGVNHLALITNDMDATVRFYHGVLGARLVAHLGNRSFRHYFFEVGPEQTVAFFEYKNTPVKAFAKPAGVPDPRAIQFDHLSLNLADERARGVAERLKENGCEVTDIVDHGFVRSIYFTDPNGIALEASWWVIDPTGATPTTATASCSPTPTPCPRSQNCEPEASWCRCRPPTSSKSPPTSPTPPDPSAGSKS